jgi:hypothetical protein
VLHPLSRLAEKLQIDRPLLYALVARAWQAMAGPLTIVFLILTLSPAERGVYYGLSTIMSIQLFFELGLLNILVSQTGHQNSALLAAENEVQRLQASGRLGQLIFASQAWFVVASLIYALAAIGFGWKVLSDKSTAIQWWLPLVALSVVAAGSVALSPRLAILEGAGYRDSVYRARLIQMLTGAVVVWAALLLGLKIWALVAASGVQLLTSFLLTHVFYRQFFATHVLNKDSLVGQLNSTDSGLSWIKEVFPLQWRIALISIIHHAATQFFTVIVLTYDSEVEAGRLGMTLTITMAIQGMAMTWIQTKFSLVSSMHGAGQREQAGTLWRHSAVVSTGLLIAAMTVAVVIIASLQLAQRGWQDSFIEPWQLIVLGLGCLANHLIALQSFYVLSRKGRPFMFPAILGYSATGMAVVLGGYWYSTSGVICAYTLTTALITLPLHSLAYLQYRRHSETTPTA